MSAPDDALDPIVERAPDRETWVGIKQGDQEDREFDAAELQRLRAIVAAVTSLVNAYDTAPRWSKHRFLGDELADAVRDALKAEAAA